MNPGEWYERPVLTGRWVQLEPLRLDHAEGLYAAGKDLPVWNMLLYPQPTSVADMRTIVTGMLEKCERKAQIPWVQLEAATGEVVGTTSYYEIDPVHRGLWIGHTWIGTPWQRTGVNSESKLLLLERAFDVLKAKRVGWHVDILNEQSQAAVERLGAQREGLLRHHRIRPDGTMRDTVCFGMTAEEWPGVKSKLVMRLGV